MIEELLKYDTELFLFLNNLGNESWDELWRIITLKWSSIPIYAVLLYLIYKNLGLKGTVIVLIFVTALVAATDQLANLFKYGFERPRPCQVEKFTGKYAFCGPWVWKIWVFFGPCSQLYGCSCFCRFIVKEIL